jgi:hypothetical protein
MKLTQGVLYNNCHYDDENEETRPQDSPNSKRRLNATLTRKKRTRSYVYDEKGQRI